MSAAFDFVICPAMPSPLPDEWHRQAFTPGGVGAPEDGVLALAAMAWEVLLANSSAWTDFLNAPMSPETWLAGLRAVDGTVSPDMRRAFARQIHLNGKKVLRIEHSGYTWYHFMRSLSVDYEPDPWLASLAELLRLRRIAWPAKTRCDLQDGALCVRAGEGAKTVYLLPRPDGQVLLRSGQEERPLTMNWKTYADALRDGSTVESPDLYRHLFQ